VWNRKTRSFLLAVLLVPRCLLPAMAEEVPGHYDANAKTIRLYLKETEAKDAFNLLSKSSGQNLVVNNQLNGQVSLKLQGVNFEDALNALCLALGATYEKIGGVYVISQPTAEKPTPFLPTNPAAANSSTDPGQRLVSANIKNGELGQLLQQMANQAGVEIVIFGRVSGQVTARIQAMPFEAALKTLLAGSKLSYVRDGNRFLVGDPATTNGMVQQLSKSEVLYLNNITAKRFLELLPTEIDAAQIKPLQEQNAVIVTGVEQFVSKVKDYAHKIDVLQPQVALEINIVELSNDGRDRLAMLAPSITWEFVKKLETMQLRLVNDTISSLVTDGKAVVRARPSISTISGHKAKVDISEDINFELTSAIGTGAGTTITSNLQTIKAGTILEVTPTVGRDGLIHTELEIEVSGVSSFTTSVNGAQIPNVRRRLASTTVDVVDSETILIAGLTQNQERFNYQKVPYLGRIPIVGELLASHDNRKDKSELVIFVTPRLIESKAASQRAKVMELSSTDVIGPVPPAIP
jgi:type IV pilus assembly protein PilQ